MKYATELQHVRQRKRAEAQARQEHEAWQYLCAVLRASGAVTEEDLATPVGSPPATPGLWVLNAARAWGVEVRALERAEPCVGPLER